MNADPAPMEFAPPPTPGLVGALALAIAAHALLLAVLAMGLQWKRGVTPVTVEAELWSELPNDATAPPAAQTALTSASASPLVVSESDSAPAAATGASIDLHPDQALARKEKLLRESEVEEEKRRREANDTKPKEVEMEADDMNTDVEGKPHRDPT